MLGRALGYPQDYQDLRPSKRPRNVAMSEDLRSMGLEGTALADDQGMEMVMGQDPSRSEPLQYTGGSTGRLRSDERNTRKLSCKECRR